MAAIYPRYSPHVWKPFTEYEKEKKKKGKHDDVSFTRNVYCLQYRNLAPVRITCTRGFLENSPRNVAGSWYFRISPTPKWIDIFNLTRSVSSEPFCSETSFNFTLDRVRRYVCLFYVRPSALASVRRFIRDIFEYRAAVRKKERKNIRQLKCRGFCF